MPRYQTGWQAEDRAQSNSPKFAVIYQHGNGHITTYATSHDYSAASKTARQLEKRGFKGVKVINYDTARRWQRMDAYQQQKEYESDNADYNRMRNSRPTPSSGG